MADRPTPSTPVSAFSVRPTEPCPRSADGQHQYDWGGSDIAVLTSYGSCDLSAVVRLSRCRSCATGLLAVSSVEADDEDLGVLFTVDGAEVGA